MITVKEIAWLAGIVEGEGCFTYYTTPNIAIAMSDKDVIERVASLFKRHVYSYRIKSYKTQYKVCITGTNAIEWMLTIYSFMGNRRKEKIKEIVEIWITKKKRTGTNRKHRPPHKQESAIRLW